MASGTVGAALVPAADAGGRPLMGSECKDCMDSECKDCMDLDGVEWVLWHVVCCGWWYSGGSFCSCC